uniref:Nudix hydrolase domain-containing protein n=1 Tax=Rhabditophanes sp. KR3021 TaxID=114890 RepID=A0AC35TGB3_9BILA
MSSIQEYLSNITFDDTINNSPYLRPIRMKFNLGLDKKQTTWDIAAEHDSVAVVLYHTEKEELLFVRQFRPSVFVGAVRRLPENKGKSLHQIDFAKYSTDHGYTLELCAGIVDKPNQTYLEHVKDEVIEECGYCVPLESILFLKKFITGISFSGSQQSLYYAEINESMYVSCGGGNQNEGEKIENIFMSVQKVRELLAHDELKNPPGFLWAVEWFLKNKLNDYK